MKSVETIIRPTRGWELPDSCVLLQYRDLLWTLVFRDTLSRHKQTLLGPVWYLIQPLLTGVFFTVVFSRGARLSTEEVPAFLFYLAGLVSWSYFTQAFEGVCGCFQREAHLLRKIYFPRILIPISAVVAKIVPNLFQLGLLLCSMVYYAVTGKFTRMPGWPIALLPLVVLHTGALALGCGLWIAALSAKYRDLNHLLHYLIQIGMYCTPIIYPLSTIPAAWQELLLINPMTSIIEGYRSIFFGVGGVSAGAYLFSILITLFFLWSGLLLFQRVEKRLVDTL